MEIKLNFILINIKLINNWLLILKLPCNSCNMFYMVRENNKQNVELTQLLELNLFCLQM